MTQISQIDKIKIGLNNWAKEVYSNNNHDTESYLNYIYLNLVDKLVLLDIEDHHFSKLIEDFIKEPENIFISFAYGLLIDQMKLSSLSDENKCQFYLRFSQISLKINYNSFAIKQANKAIKFAGESPSKRLSKLFLTLATANRNINEFGKAKENYDKALATSEKINDVAEVAWIYFLLGKMYLNYLQQPSRSIEYLLKAKDEFEKISENGKEKNRGISICLDELGDVYRQATDKIDLALDFYNKALLINNSNNELRGKARNLSHIALCYERTKNYELAIDYMNQSISILEDLKSQERGLGIRLLQLGNVYLKLNDYEKAEFYLIRGLKICQHYRNYQYIAKGEIYFAKLFHEKGEFLSAINHLEKALEIGNDNGFFSTSSIAADELGNILLNHFGGYEKAKKLLIDSTRFNIVTWSNIAKSSPELEEAGNNYEIARMYKSLFEKLMQDYISHFDKTINTISKTYEKLIEEEKEKIESLRTVFKFGALMSGIRHELSNSLNNINSSVEKLRRNTDNRGLIPIIDEIKTGCFSISDLIHNQTINPLTNLNLSEQFLRCDDLMPIIIEKIIDSFKYFRISFEHSNRYPKKTITCDPLTFELIVHGIILNACEAIDKNKETNSVNISNSTNSNYFTISIFDNGIGIKDDILKKIYQVGYSTKNNNMGLGIPAINYLLETIGGKLLIKSKFGFETKVDIQFPITKI